jgi:hypothetical protein
MLRPEMAAMVLGRVAQARQIVGCAPLAAAESDLTAKKPWQAQHGGRV